MIMKKDKEEVTSVAAEETAQAQQPTVENQESSEAGSIKTGDRVFIAARDSKGFDYTRACTVSKVKSKAYYFDEFKLEIQKDLVFTDPWHARRSEKRYQFK